MPRDNSSEDKAGTFQPEQIEVKYAVALELTQRALDKTDSARAAAKENGAYKERTIRFYDVPMRVSDEELALKFFDSDLILRTRVPADKKKKPDSTVKVRGPKAAARDWIAELKFDPEKLEVKREGDLVLNGKPKISDQPRPAVSLTGKQKREEVEEGDRIGIVESKKSEELAQALFKDAQEELVSKVFDGDTPWKELKVAGPVAAEVWEWKAPRLDGLEVTCERWMVKGEPIVEFSCKVDPGQEGKAAEALVVWLRDLGLKPMDTSKTRWVLTQFLGNET